MAYNNVFKILLIVIFILSFVNIASADSGPNIGETQAKSIVNNYLDDHNLPYKASTATWMIEIKNRDTQSTKWVSVSQWDVMTDNNKFLPEEDPTFEWEGTGSYAWKVFVADDQGGNVGTIWLDSESGKIIEVNVKNVTNNDTNSTNGTNLTANNTNQTSQGPLNANIALALFIVVIIVIGVVGYVIYKKQ